ncbi:hypothetical protein BDY17DRAFT_244782 [Neohortaea acidophila]|uniref:Uncharacterized protein n=1 Tax=Neohortaea acidophila TaxID=245834 RepID=A0A6A6Q5R9_9PEZI|nr:uncharacterized protein BDY17DRAFT_244782 [Neohortaea acidophila]KAF2487730.1 hypothetical protein BDY17DRAFT_244782 [Neohortaea acidophila]
MAVVRESPHAKHSPDKRDTQWPPKSPFEALLSSPSGRRKWQDRRNRLEARDTSPSPVKGRAAAAMVSADEDEGDEDEETLRLKLQAIEAKLKLKKLQKEKEDQRSNVSTSRLTRAVPSPTKSPSRPVLQPHVNRAPAEVIQVPLSPTKDRSIPLGEHKSPARARLGLDTTIKADGVSLKRARDGTHLRRANSAATSTTSSTPKPSFSERLAQSRADAQQSRVKQERIDNARSKGFGIMTRPGSHLHTNHSPLEGLTQRPTSSRVPRLDSTAGFDPFTELHLSKRHIPHVAIAREMSGKEIYTLPRLLKEVKAPTYEPPDCESDYVVFAILATKSQPFDQRLAQRTSDDRKPQEDADQPRNKFMVLHLTDLKWEVDCFLFGTAFDQFWKLTPGTLLAILNPGIMPPKGNQNTGRFSLKLGSSDDCVMEIGLARDLAYCKSVKKDGQLCGAFINGRSAELCNFHLDMLVNREGRKGRMEVNTMWRSHQDREEFRGGKSAATLLDKEDLAPQDAEASRRRIAAAQRERDLAKKLANMGGSMGSEYLRSNPTNAPTSSDPNSIIDVSAAAKAALFDKPSAADLGLLANKADNQHLSPAKDRKRHFGLGALSKTNGGRDAVGWGGARKPGLLAAPREGRLGSPEKGQTFLGAERGVGGVLAARRDGSVSPSKKRARFVLDKGIREPGRESLGEMMIKDRLAVGLHDNDDDDDDELDIV